MKSVLYILMILIFPFACKMDDKKVGKKVIFSGIVYDEKENAAAGIEIEINGEKIRSEKGVFNARVDSADRFVVNIRKFGYGLISKIYYSSIKDKKYYLTKGTVKVFDPGEEIVLQDNSMSARGSELQRVDWAGNTFRSVPLVLDKKGRLVDFGFQSAATQSAFDQISTTPINNPGAVVRIPANSLVGTGNAKPSGKVAVSLTTVDLYSEDGMPGDYSFIDRSTSSEGYMISMGAVMIEVYSEDGKAKYQLNEKSKAQLSVPIDPLQRKLNSSLPDSVAFLIYNKKAGVWEHNRWGVINEERTAFTAEVTHFSEYNMDVEKTNPACVTFRQQAGFPTSYKVASLDYSGGLRFTTTTMGGVVTEPGNCLPSDTYGAQMLFNLPSTAAVAASSLNELCVLFYDNFNDPLAIYSIPIPDPYPIKPVCSDMPPYKDCFQMTTIPFTSNLLAAARFDAAGGGGTIKWIYNGTPVTYSYEIWKTTTAAADVCVQSGGTCITIPSSTAPVGEDPKIPNAFKSATLAGISAGESVWVRMIITAPGSSSIDSNKITN